jgi:hypothetical protein
MEDLNPGFEPIEGRWGSIHHRFSTFTSIALVPAVPIIFSLKRVTCFILRNSSISIHRSQERFRRQFWTEDGNLQIATVHHRS